MTLLSMKIVRPGFLRAHSDSMSVYKTEDIRVRILNSVKFIVGKELLNASDTGREQLKIVYGEVFNENNFIPPNKIDYYVNLWNSYSKLPYKSIFIENDTGGFLIFEVQTGINFLQILPDGLIDIAVGR